MVDTSKVTLSEILNYPGNKTVLIQRSQSVEFLGEINLLTVKLVSSIIDQATTTTIKVIPFNPDEGNLTEFINNSVVLTVMHDRINIDKARGMNAAGSSLIY